MIYVCIQALERDDADSLSLEKKRIYKLEGIKVVADRPESSIGKVLRKDYTIQGMNRDMNLGESVSDMNGLNLTTGGKSGSNLSIRGFNEKQVKILVDGQPVGGGYFGSVDLNTIPASDLREIQVIKGPVSALYGSDTMGGVVNFITADPQSRFALRAGITAKRNNSNKIYLTASKSFPDWDFRIYLSRFHTDGFMLSSKFEPAAFETGDVRNQNASEQYNIQCKLNWTLFDFHSFSIQTGFTTMPEKEVTASIYERNYRKFLDWQRWYLSGITNLQLHYNLESRVGVHYEQYDDTYAEYSDPGYQNMYLQWPSKLNSWIFGIFHIFDWQTTDFWNNKLGYRYEKQAYNRKDNGNYEDWTSNNLQQQNIFWQGEISLEKVIISTGCALSLFRQKHRENWIYHVEPSLGFYYSPSNYGKFSLAYSHNTKYPTLHELFSHDKGNENLKEEKAHKLEFSWDLPFILGIAAGSLSNTLYYNMIRDLIDLTQAGYDNVAEVDSYGYEADINLHWGWDHGLSYSYLEFSKKENYSLLVVPRHTLRLEESWKLPFDLRFTYKAEWKDIRETEIGTILPSYWLHDIYLNKHWENVNVTVGLENLLDENYQEERGYPGEGFNFLVNLEVTVFLTD